MSQRILYCGDTSLKGAAAYLAGLMAHWNWACDYVPSDQPLTSDLLAANHSLFVFSDYPAQRLTTELSAAIKQRISDGAGLLMIGGWESFHGLGGDWDASPLAEVLPVEIAAADDRVNCDHLVLARPVEPQTSEPTAAVHPILAGLPWDERPPLIGGFNRVKAKPAATVLLNAVQFRLRGTPQAFGTSRIGADPLLVVGSFGAGRTAAFTSDIAPHWIGPMVDWGETRVTAQAAGADAIEVGSRYAQFFQQLLSWVRKPVPPPVWLDRSMEEV